jgi:hypothetical protein
MFDTLTIFEARPIVWLNSKWKLKELRPQRSTKGTSDEGRLRVVSYFLCDSQRTNSRISTTRLREQIFFNALWLKVGAIHLVTSILATIASAALYKDARKPA